MNGTSGISGLTGGNLLDPPEPVLSRAEWERRHGFFLDAPIRNPCRVPAPTEVQAARAAMHRAHTKARRENPKTLFPRVFPLFDDEPTVRCEEVCRVSHDV